MTTKAARFLFVALLAGILLVFSGFLAWVEPADRLAMFAAMVPYIPWLAVLAASLMLVVTVKTVIDSSRQMTRIRPFRAAATERLTSSFAAVLHEARGLSESDRRTLLVAATNAALAEVDTWDLRLCDPETPEDSNAERRGE